MTKLERQSFKLKLFCVNSVVEIKEGGNHLPCSPREFRRSINIDNCCSILVLLQLGMRTIALTKILNQLRNLWK